MRVGPGDSAPSEHFQLQTHKYQKRRLFLLPNQVRYCFVTSPPCPTSSAESPRGFSSAASRITITLTRRGSGGIWQFGDLAGGHSACAAGTPWPWTRRAPPRARPASPKLCIHLGQDASMDTSSVARRLVIGRGRCGSDVRVSTSLTSEDTCSIYENDFSAQV